MPTLKKKSSPFSICIEAAIPKVLSNDSYWFPSTFIEKYGYSLSWELLKKYRPSFVIPKYFLSDEPKEYVVCIIKSLLFLEMD